MGEFRLSQAPQWPIWKKPEPKRNQLNMRIKKPPVATNLRGGGRSFMVLLPTDKTAICLNRISQKITSTTKHVCSLKREVFPPLRFQKYENQTIN